MSKIKIRTSQNSRTTAHTPIDQQTQPPPQPNPQALVLAKALLIITNQHKQLYEQTQTFLECLSPDGTPRNNYLQELHKLQTILKNQQTAIYPQKEQTHDKKRPKNTPKN